jgi:hypothetical protein
VASGGSAFDPCPASPRLRRWVFGSLGVFIVVATIALIVPVVAWLCRARAGVNARRGARTAPLTSRDAEPRR